MKKFILLIGILIAGVIYIWSRGVILQDQAYHNFADQRMMLGIPNFVDTITNIAFLIFGGLGLIYTLKHPEKESRYSWITFFLGVGLVGFGSGYYHLAPNDSTLIWDRLPMTIGFMGIFSAIVSEHIDFPFEKYALLPLLIIGILSVWIWVWTKDLRVYYYVQLAPMLVVPCMFFFFKSRYSHNSLYLLALFFYLAAKVTEHIDLGIFNVFPLSGHSLKHILAGLVPYAAYEMLKRRKIKAS